MIRKNLKQVLDNSATGGSIGPVVSRKDASGVDGGMPSESREQGNASYCPTVAAVDVPRVACRDVVGACLGISYNPPAVRRMESR